MQVGELLEAKQDYAGAEAAYRRAAELEPGPEIAARVAVAAERARDARLPAEFRAIPASTRVTRGDLAALIGVRLEATLRQAPEQQVVVTDADRHWAAPWIGPVARTGILDAYENHTFQPSAPLRRAELAEAVRELVTLLARQSPELRVRLAERPRIADMSTGHLSYLDAVAAVASGVLPLTEQGRFEPNRPVSGAEAVDAIDRLRQLAGTVR
jgi:hypothetical protein